MWDYRDDLAYRKLLGEELTLRERVVLSVSNFILDWQYRMDYWRSDRRMRKDLKTAKKLLAQYLNEHSHSTPPVPGCQQLCGVSYPKSPNCSLNSPGCMNKKGGP